MGSIYFVGGSSLKPTVSLRFCRETETNSVSKQNLFTWYSNILSKKLNTPGEPSAFFYTIFSRGLFRPSDHFRQWYNASTANHTKKMHKNSSANGAIYNWKLVSVSQCKTLTLESRTLRTGGASVLSLTGQNGWRRFNSSARKSQTSIWPDGRPSKCSATFPSPWHK